MTLMDVAPPQSNTKWPIPPEDGYFADDLDKIPDLPPHTQLIDGSLVFVSPQMIFHKRAMLRLWRAFDDAATAEFAAHTEMTIVLGPKQRPEPDVLVTWALAENKQRQTSFTPEDVLLVIEIVSDESRLRDRERKPQLYAAAGIKVFWRVELDEQDKAVVYSYELDPATKSYVATGIHRDRITAAWPFPVDIDLTAIEQLPKS
jgi:Uma2 family endonuclease